MTSGFQSDDNRKHPWSLFKKQMVVWFIQHVTFIFNSNFLIPVKKRALSPFLFNIVKEVLGSVISQGKDAKHMDDGNKTLCRHRWYNCVCRKSWGIHKNVNRTSKIIKQCVRIQDH